MFQIHEFHDMKQNRFNEIEQYQILFLAFLYHYNLPIRQTAKISHRRIQSIPLKPSSQTETHHLKYKLKCSIVLKKTTQPHK